MSTNRDYFTSKNLFNHHTWKIPSPINTPSWKIDHHLTLAFVLSAVFLCVRSLTTMYDCSSLTCESSSESCRTVSCQLLRGASNRLDRPSASSGSDGASDSGT